MIIDGFGIGSAPDAKDFGDYGANTCQHILEQNPSLSFPNLQKLGLLEKKPNNQLIEINPNKDTLSGISEMFGSILPKMHTFAGEIPIDLIKKIESAIGTKTLYGKAGSGTQIMKEYGEENLKTGFPILYTSQDSVIQLLAHEEVTPPSVLYYYCQVIRDLVNPLFPIGRIIARPFSGYSSDSFQRTNRRKDFVDHTRNNPFLTSLHKKDISICGNRIIYEIFGEDIIFPFPGGNNNELYGNLMQEFSNKPSLKNALYVIDLEDFDMLYGHRRDPKGYGAALEKLDVFIGDFLPLLTSDDFLILSADHGNDPTFSGHTDHTRETVPLIGYNILSGCKVIGTFEGFFYISTLIQHYFELTTA